MISAIYTGTVYHQRFKYKSYSFKNNFYWLAINLDELSELHSALPIFSHNRRNLFEFNDKDHLDLGLPTLKENYLQFAKMNGVEEELTSITIYTQVRLWGYVFNPLSVVHMIGLSGQEYAIIEIANTFNELKPYFVGPEHFTKLGVMEIMTSKFFYISPFIDHDALMIFKADFSGPLKIDIQIEKSGEKILTAGVLAYRKNMSFRNLLSSFFHFPVMSFAIIFLIHWHAAKLWLMNIPYFKKDQFPELQRGATVWKK